jgi:hypothetical protein
MMLRFAQSGQSIMNPANSFSEPLTKWRRSWRWPKHAIGHCKKCYGQHETQKPPPERLGCVRR